MVPLPAGVAARRGQLLATRWRQCLQGVAGRWPITVQAEGAAERHWRRRLLCFPHPPAPVCRLGVLRARQRAAHIKPYSESGPHAVSNGLLLRSGLNKLFDSGYVTVTPEHRVEELHRQEQIEYQNMGFVALEEIYKRFNAYNNQVYLFHYGGHSNSELLRLHGTAGSAENLGGKSGQQQNLKLVFLNGSDDRMVKVWDAQSGSAY